MKNIACAELLAFLLVNWPFLGVEKRSLAQNVQEEQIFPTHPDPKRWDENWASYGCSKSRRWQVRGYWGVGWSSSCSRFALRAKLVCRASSNSPITSHLSPKALIVIDLTFLTTVNCGLNVQKLYIQMIWLSKWKFRDLPRNLTNEFGYNEWNVFSMLEVNEAHVKDFYLQVISQDFFFFSLERTYAQLSTNIDGVHNNAQRFVASISKK